MECGSTLYNYRDGKMAACTQDQGKEKKYGEAITASCVPATLGESGGMPPRTFFGFFHPLKLIPVHFQQSLFSYELVIIQT